MGFSDGSAGKETTCTAEDSRDVGLIPVSGRPLEEHMPTHSSILGWKIPWTEELVRYSPKGLKELGKTDRLTLSLSLFTYAIIYICQKLQNRIQKEADFIG